MEPLIPCESIARVAACATRKAARTFKSITKSSEVGINVHKSLRAIAASVIDKNMEAVNVLDACNELVVGNVRRPRLDAIRRMRPELVEVALGSCHSDDACSRIGKGFGTGSPDTATGAGNERLLSVKHC